jgi:hypothetical protein
MDNRSARLAANEAVFRAGNERIDAMLADQGGTTAYLSECGDPACFRIDLSNRECEEAARFTIVEKRGAAHEIVERSDPRAV